MDNKNLLMVVGAVVLILVVGFVVYNNSTATGNLVVMSGTSGCYEENDVGMDEYDTGDVYFINEMGESDHERDLCSVDGRDLLTEYSCDENGAVLKSISTCKLGCFDGACRTR